MFVKMAEFYSGAKIKEGLFCFLFVFVARFVVLFATISSLVFQWKHLGIFNKINMRLNLYVMSHQNYKKLWSLSLCDSYLEEVLISFEVFAGDQFQFTIRVHVGPFICMYVMGLSGPYPPFRKSVILDITQIQRIRQFKLTLAQIILKKYLQILKTFWTNEKSLIDWKMFMIIYGMLTCIPIQSKHVP